MGSKLREWTSTILADDDDDTTIMKAKFDDGAIHEIAGLLQRKWKALKACRGTTSAYEGVRQNGETIYVRYRSERPGAEMYGLYADKKFITQVLIKYFDTPDHAREFAVKLAKEYVQNEAWTKIDAVRRRDEGLPKRVRKRPATSLQDDSSTTTTQAASSSGGAPDSATSACVKSSTLCEIPDLFMDCLSSSDDSNES